MPVTQQAIIAATSELKNLFLLIKLLLFKLIMFLTVCKDNQIPLNKKPEYRRYSDFADFETFFADFATLLQILQLEELP
jgi:hypothetical protein